MVNAKELRIGNELWIGENKDVYKVFGISFDRREGWMLGDVPVSVFEPIPLSPEILEKAGFHNESDLGTDYFKIKKKLCKSGWSERFTYYLPYKNLSTYTGDVTIKYLHQLQNLYHALTGEELEIKSPL